MTLFATYKEGEGSAAEAAQFTGDDLSSLPDTTALSVSGKSTVTAGAETCANIKRPVFVITLTSRVCIF